MNVYSFEVKDKTYKVRYTIEGLSKLEQWLGTGVSKILEEETFGFNRIVNFLRAGLYHADKGITEQRASRLYQDYVEEGNSPKELYTALFELYGKSVKQYLAPDEDTDEDDEGND